MAWLFCWFANCGCVAARDWAGWSGTGSILAFKTNDPSTTAIAVANSAPFDLTLSSGTVLANNDPAGGSLNGTGTIYVNQGATLGVAQAVGSLARIAGPLFAGIFFMMHPAWPYLACAAMALVACAVVVVKLIPSLRSHAAENA